MRRLKAFLLALLFAALLLILPILAQDEIYFTAINNTLLELNDKTMPIKVRGTIYLPNSVFNSSELGTYCVYTRSKQLVMLSDLERMLYFDMGEGTCYDDQDESFPYAAIYHNDTAYLPALFVADYFGCEFTYISNDYAPIIRLTKGHVLADDAFLRGASALMATRLSQYLAAKETATATPTETPAVIAPTPAPTQTPPETPSPTPIAEPTSTPRPTASPKPDRSNVSVYLAFLGLSEESEACAELLCSRGYNPCYFVFPKEIRQYPGLIRKLRGIGCGIGILFCDDLAEEYAEASALLREAAHMVTFLAAAAQQLTPEALEAARKTELLLWSAQPPESEIHSLLAKLERADRRCDLILDGGMRADEISALADYLHAESYTVRQITELSDAAPIIAE